MKSQIIKAHLAVLLVNALYGANHVIAKGVMPKFLSPSVFILMRVAGAVSLFWIVSLFLPKEKIAKKDLGRIALCGLFGVSVNQLFFFYGLNLSSSINAGIIMTINPIIVVILSYFLLKESITVKKAFGIGLGALGAILLTLTAGTGSGDSVIGDLFLFINAVSYGVYLVIVKPLMQKYKPFTVITYVFTFGLVYVLLFPPTIVNLVQTNFATIPFDVWMKIIYVIIGVTFLTYLLTVYGLKTLTPAISSAYIYLQPVLVIFFAVILSYFAIVDDYTDTITLEKIIYMLLIFMGVYITSSAKFLKRRN